MIFWLYYICQDVESGMTGVKSEGEQGDGGEASARTEAEEALAALQQEVLTNRAVVLALRTVKQVRV